jgi:L-gulonate 3-dehydrogenase
MKMAQAVGIIGTGLIGRAWAIAFARAGCDVRLFDPADGAAEKALALIAGTTRDMENYDLLGGQVPAAVDARITAAKSLAAAVDGVMHVQENSPENPETKKALFTELDAVVPADAIIASSTSAILPSVFTGHIKSRERCLVAHPLNPPHLIPAVEVVPAPWTSADALERTRQLMIGIGQKPIMMKHEIDGFLMNRLQGALLEECFRLVASGIVTPEDVDVGLREGLALRWSFMGPFETIDLNAQGGVTDYVARYQKSYAWQFESQKQRVDWQGPVLETVSGARRKQLAAEHIADRQAWRDRRLMALAAHKRRAASDLGE